MTAGVVANIKTILASVAGVLLILLQIINVLLSNDLESAVQKKTQVIEQKIQQNTAITKESNEAIKDIDKKTSTLDPAERAEVLRQINQKLNTIEGAEKEIRTEVEKAQKRDGS